MKIMIFGATGQLGRTLFETAPKTHVLIAPTRQECDISDYPRLEKIIQNVKPDVIINAAAKTNVSLIEKTENRQEAYGVNTLGAGNLAKISAALGIRLIHISTDYVFEGTKNLPYTPSASKFPLNYYGKTKSWGEDDVESMNSNSVILRTSWLYSKYPGNFMTKMLQKLQEDRPIYVVDDQLGTPTSTISLTYAIWGIINRPAMRGTYHFSDSGVASWYDFTIAIQRLAIQIPLFTVKASVIPVHTSGSMFNDVNRPTYSVLDCEKTEKALGYPRAHWQECLESVLRSINKE